MYSKRILMHKRHGYVQFLALLTSAAGIVLGMAISPVWYLVAALGIFGPPILRAFHLLGDVDEFQREASAGAGLAAYTVAGAYFLVLLAGATAEPDGQPDFRSLALFGFTLTVGTYYVAYVLRFWDPGKAGRRILAAFGGFWGIFVLASEFGDWASLAWELLAVPLPFVGLWFLSKRWPRATAVAIGALALFVFVFFDLWRAFWDEPQRFFTFFLLPVPLGLAAWCFARAGDETS